MMTAVLANAHAFVCGFQLLSFGGKNLDNQCRNGQEKPLDGDPPPTNENPPKEAMMFVFQLGFSDHLNIHIGAATFWTSHFCFLPSNSFALWVKPILFPFQSKINRIFCQRKREG